MVSEPDTGWCVSEGLNPEGRWTWGAKHRAICQRGGWAPKGGGMRGQISGDVRVKRLSPKGWTWGDVSARTMGHERRVDLEGSHINRRKERALKRGGLRSHINWGGERKTLYKSVEISPIFKNLAKTWKRQYKVAVGLGLDGYHFLFLPINISNKIKL